MDARTELVVGGMATVAASVAVVCAVALTNSVALADSPGSSVASARVLVPAAASASADFAALDAEVPPQPEVVEAPEVVEPPAPIVVGDDDTSASKPAPPPPTSPAAPVAPVPPASEDAAVAASMKAGTWDAVRSWALSHGWSQERIAEWIVRLEQERAAAADRNRPTDGEELKPETPDAGLLPPPAPAPERPANAGSSADRKESSDSVHGGAKKDRSRDSPDRRDR